VRVSLPSLLCAVALRGQEPPHLTIEHYTLPNGLEVVLSEDHSTPVVAVSTYYRVGSADEAIGHTGVAHLVEHVAYAAVEHVPPKHFRQWLGTGDAGSAGSTDEDRTRFDEWMPSGALPLALQLDADRMSRVLPSVDEAAVDRQRVAAEIERRERVDSVPYARGDEVMRAALFPPGHPYSWPLFGLPSDVAEASVKDVRAFLKRYYAPNAAALAIAGDFLPDSAKRWVARAFADIPRSSGAGARPHAVTFALDHDSLVVLEDRVQLPRVCYAWHSVKAFHPDDAALDALAYVLADGPESRLYTRLVRDEQVAQSVAAEQQGRRLDGHFTLAVTASPGVTPSQIDTLVARELTRVIDSGVTEHELDRVRQRRRAKMLEDFTNVARRAEVLNYYNYFAGSPDYAANDMDRYDRLSPDDVRRVAAHYLGAHRVILTIVPLGRAAIRIRVPAS